MRVIVLSDSMLILVGGALTIDRFTAVPDCIVPDPRRGILSYSVSGGVMRARIDALHAGGRVRTFYSTGGRTVFPSMGATNIADPGAAADVEGYRLTATGEGGREVTRRLDFRYRRSTFDLLPPVAHTRSGGDFYTRYQSRARVLNVDSISCSFKFATVIEGESGRAGSADIVASGSGDPLVRCDVVWGSLAKARAGGQVEWTARVTDRCTQGRITRAASVNPIR
jgi:hypothetical protein